MQVYLNGKCDAYVWLGLVHLVRVISPQPRRLLLELCAQRTGTWFLGRRRRRQMMVAGAICGRQCGVRMMMQVLWMVVMMQLMMVAVVVVVVG